MTALDKQARELARQKIERMYQRAMDLRDSTPIRDWRTADKTERVYLAAYMKAHKLARDVDGFKKSTRQYRRAIRDNA